MPSLMDLINGGGGSSLGLPNGLASFIKNNPDMRNVNQVYQEIGQPSLEQSMNKWVDYWTNSPTYKERWLRERGYGQDNAALTDLRKNELSRGVARQMGMNADTLKNLDNFNVRNNLSGASKSWTGAISHPDTGEISLKRSTVQESTDPKFGSWRGGWVASTLAHEMGHMLPNADTPSNAINTVRDALQPVFDKYKKSDEDRYYFNQSTEIRGYINSLREDFSRRFGYDINKDFTEKDYEKAIQSLRSLPGRTEGEKILMNLPKDKFIWMMNNVAQNEQGNSLLGGLANRTA